MRVEGKADIRSQREHALALKANAGRTVPKKGTSVVKYDTVYRVRKMVDMANVSVSDVPRTELKIRKIGQSIPWMAVRPVGEGASKAGVDV